MFKSLNSVEGGLSLGRSDRPAGVAAGERGRNARATAASTATHRLCRARLASLGWQAGLAGGHDRPPRATLGARERKTIMQQITLDAEAGQVSAELTRRGVAADTRVHVLVEIVDTAEPPMAAIAQAGTGFDWLADEPDLYSDADLVERAG